jgi:hypothetical protein
VGTIRTTSSNSPIQIEDSANKMYVWNAYNQVPRTTVNTHNSSFSTTTTIGPIPWGNSGSPLSQFRVDFVVGLATRCRCDLIAAAFANASGGNRAAISVGLNSSSAVASGSMNTGEQTIPTVGAYATLHAAYDKLTTANCHFFQALWSANISAASGIGFSSGDNGPPGMIVTVFG